MSDRVRVGNGCTSLSEDSKAAGAQESASAVALGVVHALYSAPSLHRLQPVRAQCLCEHSDRQEVQEVGAAEGGRGGCCVMIMRMCDDSAIVVITMHRFPLPHRHVCGSQRQRQTDRRRAETQALAGLLTGRLCLSALSLPLPAPPFLPPFPSLCLPRFFHLFVSPTGSVVWPGRSRRVRWANRDPMTERLLH